MVDWVETFNRDSAYHRQRIRHTLYSSRQTPGGGHVTIRSLRELSRLHKVVKQYVGTGRWDSRAGEGSVGEFRFVRAQIFGAPVVLDLPAEEKKLCEDVGCDQDLDRAMTLVNEDFWMIYEAAAEVQGGTRDDREFDEWLLIAVTLLGGWDSDETKEVLEEMLEQENQWKSQRGPGLRMTLDH